MLAAAKAACLSKTLKKDLRWEFAKSNPNKTFLFTDYYWARFFHDGRNAVVRITKRPRLVFFSKENLLLDPRFRLQGGHPKKESDIRRFSDNASLKAEYRKFLAINQARQAAGNPPLMHVRETVGPTAGKPFFPAAEAGPVLEQIDQNTGDLFDALMLENIKDEKIVSIRRA